MTRRLIRSISGMPVQRCEGLPAPTLTIIIDQSYAVYNSYHHSQNRMTSETINSHNDNSTQARNSSLYGDSTGRGSLCKRQLPSLWMRDSNIYIAIFTRDWADCRLWPG